MRGGHTSSIYDLDSGEPSLFCAIPMYPGLWMTNPTLPHSSGPTSCDQEALIELPFACVGHQSVQDE